MLTLEEQKYLANNFRFLQEVKNEDLISFEQLVDPEFLQSYLNELQEHFKTDKKFVAASQFAKRIGFAMAIPILYAMTIYDKKIDTSPANCFLISSYNNEKWMPQLYLKNLNAVEPSLEDRLSWRESIIEDLFKQNLTPILKKLAAISSVPMPILWENVAIYVYWLYEKRIQEGVANGLKRQILSDFYYLIHQAPGCFFGEVENPLKKFFGAMCELPISVEPVRIRRTCCFYYEIAPNGECCITCPKGKREIEHFNIS
jgi:ferric iron reductase protein FhuF